VNDSRGIDHLVVAVDDLTSARQRYSKLGFSTTPQGRHPWGTANHLVQFSRNFIELVGVVDRHALVAMSDEHFSFSAQLDGFLRKREGLAMLVLTTEDARADADEWREKGLRVFAPHHWSRKAILPDGSESTVAFTLTFVTDPSMPEIAFFCCQQHNPEIFWKPQYQNHANGAGAVCAVTLVDPQPARHRAFFSRLLGSKDIEESPGVLLIHCAGAVLRVLTPQRFAARYPVARSVAQAGLAGQGTAFGAATLAADDLERVARCLDDNAVDYSRVDSAIQVAEAQCCGLVLEFAPSQAGNRAA
jgi:hypothetical protein